MSNVHKLKTAINDEDTILDQACAWIVKIDRGLSNQEVAVFQQWTFHCPENMTIMLQVAKMWDKVDEIAELTELCTTANNKQRRVSPWLGAIAASLFLTFSVGYLSGFEPLQFFSASEQQNVIAQQLSYQTDVGESSTFMLPDNSKLVLNTNSFVQINYTPDARIIEMQRGEMYIEVAHEQLRPLSVLAGGQAIQAVGTAFNVQIKADQVELIVTDGQVLVKEKSIHQFNTLAKAKRTRFINNALSVSVGEKVNLIPGIGILQQVVKVDELDITKALSWRDGNLIFIGDETLAEAIAEISRYTEVSFEFDQNIHIDQIKIAGVFKAGDVSGLLDVLATNFNIMHKQISANRIKLYYQG